LPIHGRKPPGDKELKLNSGDVMNFAMDMPNSKTLFQYPIKRAVRSHC
jgi:hypothetical protein